MAITLTTPSRTFPLGATRARSRRLKSLGQGAWDFFAAVGDLRAAPHWRELARQVALTDPVLAGHLRLAAWQCGAF